MGRPVDCATGTGTGGVSECVWVRDQTVVRVCECECECQCVCACVLCLCLCVWESVGLGRLSDWGASGIGETRGLGTGDWGWTDWDGFLGLRVGRGTQVIRTWDRVGSGGAGSGAHSFLLLINETAIHSESRLSLMVIGESTQTARDGPCESV